MTVCKRNGVNLNNAIKVAAISAVMSVLAACGDDGSTKGTEPTDSDVIAATFDDLPACSEKRQGAVGYVKDKKITYVCEDGKWVSDGEDSSSSNHCEDASEGCDKAISSSSKAKSSSSKKTSSSSLENKTKSSSSVSKTSSSSSVKINSSSSKIKSSSSSETKEGSSAHDTISVTAIKNKSVSGVSQKGPFVTGSTVKLYELDGKTYAQTGKSFTGKIASDDGKFSVSSVTLASQYALLEANGYFRNEVTGKKSSGTVTLNALTDLSAREKVNVNLLTHLEYERALYLVGTGVNVSTAKKQAEAEIFNAFGIQGDFANSEDLDIFSKGEGNAALLAFSVLMLRDLSEADLTELLTKFAIDIEKDGKWNDDATKAKIADWAQSKDVAGTLATIRSNIEKWNLGTVPEFEKFVRNFWYTNYGLGDCDKARKGEVIAAKNELSSTYSTQIRFICKSGAWVEASDIEKDFYNSEKSKGGDDGELWIGTVTKKMYKYDEALGKWVTATRNDTTLKLMGCTTNRTGIVGWSSTDDVYYICKNSDWQKAREIDYDTYGENCSSKEEGKTIVGVVTSTNKYYCTSNGWVKITIDWSWDVPKEARLNPEITYGTMTDSRDKKIYKTVKIGNQVWMAENLNYADSAKTPSLKRKNWCFDNDSLKCKVTGRLYTWAAAIDSVKLASDADNPQDCGYKKTCMLPAKVQGLCPTGWHLPDSTEWNTLLTTVGGQSTAGKVLKSQTGWYNSHNGTDAFGFSALPAGKISDGYYFSKVEDLSAAFWSATEYDSLHAYRIYLRYDYENANLNGCTKFFVGLSIRCLKD
jgi:uncharacterized protein (TIGR02145 family)